MKSIFRCLLVIIIITCFTWSRILAQSSIAINDSLYSDILKESRPVQIYLPKDYKPGSSDKYDVIYVLDGEWNSTVSLQMSQYLMNEGLIPQNIIVSVPNIYKDNINMRDKDFSPVAVPGEPVSGGGDAFLSFLKTELLPYINKKYPATGKNTLFGQSLGGLFAMYVLLKDPSLFQSYLLADPSFWYDDRYMIKLAEKRLGELKNKEIAIWITGRQGAPSSEMGIDAMDSVLTRSAPEGMHWQIIEAGHETHTSTQIKTLYDGLKFVYEGYQRDSVSIMPVKGIFLPGKAFTIWCGNEFLDNVRYNIDGSEPTLNSLKMQAENMVTLKDNSKLIVKSFCTRPEYNQVIYADFITGNILPSQSKPKTVKPGGLKYQYYKGDWQELPDFKKLKGSITELTGKEFSLKNPEQTNAAYLVNGYIEIQKNGYYIFRLIGGEGANFFLGGKLLIANKGARDEKSNSYMVPLEKGFYQVKLELLRKKTGENFIIIYDVPGAGGNFIPLPSSLLYSKN